MRLPIETLSIVSQSRDNDSSRLKASFILAELGRVTSVAAASAVAVSAQSCASGPDRVDGSDSSCDGPVNGMERVGGRKDER
jgi:hypothetical protein